jgi:hypothetical protein
LILAAQFPDLLWPVFLLLGIEHVRIDPGNTAFTPLDFYDYPVSHSLAAVVGWSIAFALVHWTIKQDSRSSFVLGLSVLSHWILDFVSHRPDLPLLPRGHRHVGLGLWNSVPITVSVELLLWLAGLLIYLSVSKATDAVGRIAFSIFAMFVLMLYAGNVIGGAPPGVSAIAWFGLSQWLMVGWAYWLDRHRMSLVRSQMAATTACGLAAFVA